MDRDRRAPALTLDDLGARVCILGPSNSGKSTLAAMIGAAGRRDVVHLDQLHHLPGTDWHQRPAAEFLALHDAAIAGERWVIEGNYSRSLPQRLARATGVILLHVPRAVSLWRYARRTLFEGERRIGGLPGARETLKFEMAHHIAFDAPGRLSRNAALVEVAGVPCIRLRSRKAVARFRAANGL